LAEARRLNPNLTIEWQIAHQSSQPALLYRRSGGSQDRARGPRLSAATGTGWRLLRGSCFGRAGGRRSKPAAPRRFRQPARRSRQHFRGAATSAILYENVLYSMKN